MPSSCRLLSLSLLLVASGVWGKNYDLDYQVRLVPHSDLAEVSIRLEDGQAVRSIDFALGDEGRYSDFKATGRWEQSDPARGVWTPASGESVLSYKVRINHSRGDDRFDARITDDWALLRGDDLIPPGRMAAVEGAHLKARLQFELPKGWKSVETGWPLVGPNRFRIDNPSRLFDRPTGWILAGKIGSRRTQLGDTKLTVAAPLGEGMRRMDITTLLTFIWPQVQAVFPRTLDKLLVVGAGDPMWRGGLSASNSLFLHSSRPLVSENGTSALVHELVHVISRIRDTDRSDWISEGIAEYYSIELIRRAGGMSDDRYQQIRKKLTSWSKEVTSLRGEQSTGVVTARSVLLLQALDAEIRKASNDERSLDDVTRGMMRMDQVSTKDFIALTESVLGGKSRVLDTRLLK
jgi:predicted metalloprotease with PDZ domain